MSLLIYFFLLFLSALPNAQLTPQIQSIMALHFSGVGYPNDASADAAMTEVKAMHPVSYTAPLAEEFAAQIQ